MPSNALHHWFHRWHCEIFHDREHQHWNGVYGHTRYKWRWQFYIRKLQQFLFRLWQTYALVLRSLQQSILSEELQVFVICSLVVFLQEIFAQISYTQFIKARLNPINVFSLVGLGMSLTRATLEWAQIQFMCARFIQEAQPFTADVTIAYTFTFMSELFHLTCTNDLLFLQSTEWSGPVSESDWRRRYCMFTFSLVNLWTI